MKAKEWVKCFQVALRKENLNDFTKQYADETLALIAKRGGSLASLEGAVREQEQKFKAMCKLLPVTEMTDFMGSPGVSFFYDLMEEHAPEVWDTFSRFCMKQDERKARKAAHVRFRQNMAKTNAEPDVQLRIALMFAALMESLTETQEIREVYQSPLLS